MLITATSQRRKPNTRLALLVPKSKNSCLFTTLKDIYTLKGLAFEEVLDHRKTTQGGLIKTLWGGKKRRGGRYPILYTWIPPILHAHTHRHPP